MNEFCPVLLSGFGGSVIGALFFGGLWWTVQKGAAARHAALWFSVSLLMRTSLALVSIYGIGGGDWRRLTACLVGFMVSRQGVSWITRPRIAVATGIRHAP